jgi:transposase
MLSLGMADFDNLPDNPEALRKLLGEQRAVVVQRDEVIAQKDLLLAQQDAIITKQGALLTLREAALERLKAALVWFQQRMFGRSSEKIPSSVLQKILDGCAEVFGEEFLGGDENAEDATTPVGEADTPTGDEDSPSKSPEASEDEDSENDEVTVKGYTRRSGGRRDHSSGLPRVVLSHDLPEEDRICPCCGDPMEKFGATETKLLDFLAPLFYSLVHARSKYVCKKEGCQDEVTPVTAPVPKTPLYKSLPGPGLLAHMLVSKYADHLPLTRQRKIYKRFGVEIAVSTMTRWVEKAADFLEPLYSLLKKKVLASEIIQTDDTRLTILQASPPGSKKVPEDREPPKRARFWVYRGDAKQPYVAFDVTDDWSKEGPAEFLSGYKGILQADGYGGYDHLFETTEMREAGCMAHSRRYFSKAKAVDKVNAAKALRFFQKVYRVERQAKKDKLSPDARLEFRKKCSAPVMEAFKVWLDEMEPKALPKGPLAKAIGYALNQWDALNLFLTNGNIEIDNNASERELRQVVLGRNNWKFAASDAGAKRAVIVYSVIASAVRCGIDPLAYLRNVFSDLPGLPRDGPIPEEVLETFLPDRWATDAKFQDGIFAHVGPEILRSLSASLEDIASTR